MTPEWWLALYIVFMARRDDLLELEARRRVWEQVEKYPGLHLSEIARGAGLEINHAKHHLRHLEKHGMVSSQKEEGYWRFHPLHEGRFGAQERLGVEQKKVLSFLRRPLPLHVTLLLLDQDAMNHGELREATGAAHGTLHYHLKKMENEGLLASEKDGRQRLYRLADKTQVLRLMIEHKPPDRLVAGFLEAWETLEL